MAINFPGSLDDFPEIPASLRMSQNDASGRSHRDILNDHGDAIEALESEAMKDFNATRAPTNGVDTIPRLHCFSSTGCAMATQSMRTVYFTAWQSINVDQVTTYTNSQPATATITLARVGLYSVDANDGLTALLASTTNDTSMWTSATTAYTKAFDTDVDLVAGTRYAIGCLVVTSGNAGNLHGVSLSTYQIANIPPRISQRTNSISDLPASVSSGSLSNGQYVPYAYLDHS